MANDDTKDLKKAILGDKDTDSESRYYSDDVQAAAMADLNMDPDNLEETKEDPVTSGDVSYGDLDVDTEDIDMDG